MGKIDDAKSAVAIVESEIEAMRTELQAKRRELFRLQNSTDEGDAARAGVLERIVNQLDSELPFDRLAAGEPKPALQFKLEKAKDDLDRLRRERYTLWRDITNLEQEGHRFGDLLPVMEAIKTLTDFWNRTGWPPSLSSRSLVGLRAEYENLMQRLAYLPVWKARLAEYGEDEWKPPSAEVSPGEVKAKFLGDRLAWPY